MAVKYYVPHGLRRLEQYRGDKYFEVSRGGALAAVARRCVYRWYKYLVPQLGQNIHTRLHYGARLLLWAATQSGCCATGHSLQGLQSVSDSVVGHSCQREASHCDLRAPAKQADVLVKIGAWQANLVRKQGGWLGWPVA